MSRMKRILVLAAALIGVVIFASACTSSGGGGNGQASETKRQQSNYDRLVAHDPAHTMQVSPTRNTINRWIDTWGKDPNKLAYVYFENSSGQYTGYYVLKGLPVSYCTSLTPTQHVNYDNGDGGGGDVVLNNPSIDGVFYSGSECNTYYGFTADTGAYIEYTAGLGINVLIYDQPLSGHPNIPNLAPTK